MKRAGTVSAIVTALLRGTRTLFGDCVAFFKILFRHRVISFQFISSQHSTV